MAPTASRSSSGGGGALVSYCAAAASLLANATSSSSVRLSLPGSGGCHATPFEVLVHHHGANERWHPVVTCPVARLLPLEIALACPGGCRLMLRSLNASALAAKSLTSDSEGAVKEVLESAPSPLVTTPEPRSAVPNAPTARLAFFVRPPFEPPVRESASAFVAQLTTALDAPDFSLRPGRLVLEDVSSTGAYVLMDVMPEESLFGGLRGGVSGPANAKVLQRLAVHASGLAVGAARRSFDPWPYGIVLLEEPTGHGYAATRTPGLAPPGGRGDMRLWPRLDAADLAGVAAVARNHTRNPNLAAEAATYDDDGDGEDSYGDDVEDAIEEALLHDKAELKRDLDAALNLEDVRNEPVLKSIVLLLAAALLYCGMREHRLGCFGRGKCCAPNGRCRDVDVLRRAQAQCRRWLAPRHRPLRLPARALRSGANGGIEARTFVGSEAGFSVSHACDELDSPSGGGRADWWRGDWFNLAL